MSESAEEKPEGYPRHRLMGLLAGPLVAALVMLAPAPEGLSQKGWWIAGAGLWMAIWWMTEAIPLAATAFLPVVLFPTFGLGTLKETAPSYAHPLIFLFLGGFLLARAMRVWDLDKRLALKVLSVVGPSPRRMIAGFMAVTAFLSMWVSNTATAMVMLPIALSIVATISDSPEESATGFSSALLLGIAYAATIGGMGTIIGTPPNALFAAFMSDTYGVEVGFFRWMLVGVPLVVVMLPMAWFFLTHVTFHIQGGKPQRASEAIAQRLEALGPTCRAERMVAGVMLMAAALWIFKPLILRAFPNLGLTDAGIAMSCALLLFLLPVDLKSARFVLNWKEAVAIPWDVLILFGGGLALASGIGESDLATWIGGQLSGLQMLPVFLLLLALGVLIVFVGELASNTAMAAVFLPVAGATALSMGNEAIVLTLPIALFATLGFMLPVATPPNAIIFGSDEVKMRDMIRAGILLDLIGIVVVAVAVVTLGQWVLT